MTKQYATDLNDAQWERLEPRLVKKKRRGPKSRVNMRGVVNAIFYRLRTGCQWRMLPKEYPNWEKVSGYWQRWSRNGTWEKVNADLREAVRIKAGKKAEPTAAIIDSQSAKTAQKGARGYDAGKKIKGRKRHVAVDTLGNLLCVVVHAAGVQDRDGAMMVIAKVYHLFSFIKLVWADGGYAGKLVTWVYENLGWNLSIVKRSDKARGFILLPRRWVVERFFAWLSFDRLHSKDYHHNPRSSEAAIYASSVKLLLCKLSHA